VRRFISLAKVNRREKKAAPTRKQARSVEKIPNLHAWEYAHGNAEEVSRMRAETPATHPAKQADR